MSQRIKSYLFGNWKWIAALIGVVLLDGISTGIGIHYGLVVERNPVWVNTPLAGLGFWGSQVLRIGVILLLALFVGTSRSGFVRRWALQAGMVAYSLIPLNNIIHIAIAVVQGKQVAQGNPMSFGMMFGIALAGYGVGALCLWLWRWMGRRRKSAQ